MPDWSNLYGTLRTDTAGEDLTASRGTAITAASPAHTKGSYTQLVASTPFETAGIAIKLVNNQLADYLLDIAVGGAGSEVVLISNLLVSAGKAQTGFSFFIPVQIPPGTRIAARCQASTASIVLYVSLTLFGPGFVASRSLERVTTYGAATGDSGGVGLDPGGSANTKGSYVEITASTTAPIKQVLVIIGSRANSAMTDANWLVDLAIGAGGSEQVLLPNMQCGANIQGDTVLPAVHGPYPVNIPAGTRLAARCQCDITDATDRLLDVVVIGVD